MEKHRSQEKDRLTELELFNNNEDIINSSRGSMIKMHDNVKALIKQNPNVKITQRIIKDNFGGNYATIKKYLAIVDDALSFDATLENILNKNTETNEQEKPKFKIITSNDKNYLVEITHKKEQYDIEVIAENAMDAMKTAWVQLSKK